LNHHTSPEFWEAFERLPAEIQNLARGNYELLRENPRHPSLRFKKVGGNWSVRIGMGYRALGTDADDGVLWVWIGTHAEYDKLV
jgi:hypothetical protein